MHTFQTKTSVFCAIDTPDISKALALAKTVGPITKAIKLGLEFWAAQGPKGVEAVREAAPNAALFLDMKLHDIPNTVAGAVGALTRTLAPEYITLHASGGRAMMEAAVGAVSGPTRLLAVSVLTSLNAADLEAVGQDHNAQNQVLRLAHLAHSAGVGGAVCSAAEVGALRLALGPAFDLIVPGIRPQGAAKGDQARVATPQEALLAGATHLVIGRPITSALDPCLAARNILQSLRG